MSGYDPATAKFNEVNSNDWTVFEYASPADFRDRVDISVAGVMMDCGECHVGGGGMEYVPFSNLSARTPLRNLTTGPDAAAIAAGNPQGPVTIDDYSAFNFFIDTYDVDRDGNEQEMVYIDYANTGVMEMDCLLCHLPGYDYAERTYLLRRGKIDATRAVGAGFATENALNWDQTVTDTAGTPFAAAPVGFGTTVNYVADTSVVATDIVYTSSHTGLTYDYTGTLAIPGQWFNDNLSGKPDSANCAFCHMSKPAVDWKKRGDNWPGTYTTKIAVDTDNDGIADDTEEHTFIVPLDGQYEVHANIGCMGCHERKPTAAQPESFDYLGADGYSTQGSGLLGHDPAKGAAPFSSLYNANDNAAFKSCADCHINGVSTLTEVDTDGDLVLDTVVGEGQAYGAPNPNAAHAAYGLTAKIVQAVAGTGTTLNGVPSVSHIDLMACSTCHTRKVDDGTWHNNGNPMVDASGNDVAGRLTDHENEAVIKQDMTDNSGMSWWKGKLIRASYLNTMFWRDEGTNLGFDANMDGRGGGMDAILMTQVNKLNEDNNWTSLTADAYDPQLHESVVTAAMINTRVNTFNTLLDTWVADAEGDSSDVKLSMMHVAFKDQHGVSPAAMAWGSGAGNDPEDAADDNANPCLDCHSSASNFYNGSINTAGDEVDISWDDDFVAFTKVNGMTQATDMHPNVKDRFAKRSLASQVITADHPTLTWDHDGDAGTAEIPLKTTRELPIAETMYEGTFMTNADFAASYTGGTINFGGNETGWMVYVQVRDTAGNVVKRSKKITANVASVAELLTNLGTYADGSLFNFTITANGAGDGIVLAAETAAHTVRLHPGSHAGPLGLAGAAWKANPWTGTDGNSYAGRSEWVAHLNNLFVDDYDGNGIPNTPADFGIGADPVATISAVPATVVVGSTVNLVADETVNAGYVTYSWICNDTAYETLEGATAPKTFNQVGTWKVTLKVVDEEGNLAQVHQDVVVTAPVSAMGFAPGPEEGTGVSAEQTVIFNTLPAGTTQLYIIWGDGDREVVQITGVPDAQQVTHQFRAYDMYLNGANYEYTITVRAEQVVASTDMWGNPTTETVLLEMSQFNYQLTDDIP